MLEVAPLREIFERASALQPRCMPPRAWAKRWGRILRSRTAGVQSPRGLRSDMSAHTTQRFERARCQQVAWARLYNAMSMTSVSEADKRAMLTNMNQDGTVKDWGRFYTDMH